MLLPATSDINSLEPALNPDKYSLCAGTADDAVDSGMWLHFSKVVAITVTPILAPIAFFAGLTTLGITSTGVFILAAAIYSYDYFFFSNPVSSDHRHSKHYEELASRKIAQVENENCPICLSAISHQHTQLDCNHIFDHECIKTHFNTKKEHSFTPPDLFDFMPARMIAEFDSNQPHYGKLARGRDTRETPAEIFLKEKVNTGRLTKKEFNRIIEQRDANEIEAKKHSNPGFHDCCPACKNETKAFIAYRSFDDNGILHAVREFKPP